MTENRLAIDASNISFKYPGNDYYSLNDISVKIKANSCTGIIGPNLFIGASTNGDNAIKMLAATDLHDGVIKYAVIVQWFESEELRGCCAKLVSSSAI